MSFASIDEIFPGFFSDQKKDSDPFNVYGSLAENSSPSTQIDCSAMLMHIHNCQECKNQLMAELMPHKVDTVSHITDSIENFVAYYCAMYSSYDIFLFIVFILIIWSLLSK